MKRLTFILAILLVALQQVTGQVPQMFSYQAVLRNADGTVMAKQAVGIRVNLLKATPTGTKVYSEVHDTITSEQGVVSLSIGKGSVLSGSFASIPWNEKIFIQVGVKKSGDSDYTTMGTSQILSVPYALYAGSVKEVASPTDANPDDPIFEVKNKDGKVVFGVYQGGVRIYVDDSSSGKGARGGFAVGGLSGSGKAGTTYLYITPDSTRFYIDDSTTPKGARGGFAVGGLSGSGKAGSNEYFKVSTDTSYFTNTVFVESNIISTGTVNDGVGTASELITDVDGNIYQTVKIGSQIWMKENLKTTLYANGSAIAPTDMAVYNYTLATDTLSTYGRLYSYNAVNSSSNVCPTGWHVPTDIDWRTLMGFVGGANWENDQIATGLKLMETGTISGSDGFWNISYNPANNVSGFSGRPGGYASGSAGWMFIDLGNSGNWWIKGQLQYVNLDGVESIGAVSIMSCSSMEAYSVRCIKD